MAMALMPSMGFVALRAMSNDQEVMPGYQALRRYYIRFA